MDELLDKNLSALTTFFLLHTLKNTAFLAARLPMTFDLTLPTVSSQTFSSQQPRLLLKLSLGQPLTFGAKSWFFYFCFLDFACSSFSLILCWPLTFKKKIIPVPFFRTLTFLVAPHWSWANRSFSCKNRCLGFSCSSDSGGNRLSFQYTGWFRASFFPTFLEKSTTDRIFRYLRLTKREVVPLNK